MVIEMTKKTGQGCSGIVKLGNISSIAGHLDALVEEGVIKVCDSGGSMGHPESNKWYMPAKGYNVWEDYGPKDEYKFEHKGYYINY